MDKTSGAHNELEDFGELESGTFLFNPSLPVSKKSRFGDRQWDYTNEENNRLKVLSKCKLFVDWADMTLDSPPQLAFTTRNSNQRLFVPRLPQAIIEDLKRAFFIISLFP